MNQDLFGLYNRPYIVTHLVWDYAVVIYAANDGEAFASMKANGMPSYDDGARFYTDASNPKLAGLEIITLEQYKQRQEATP